MLTQQHRKHGIEGKGEAIDLLQEHINAKTKVPLKESGPNYSESHGVTLSLVVMYLSECVKIPSDQTNATHNSSSHTNPEAGKDIRLMVGLLQDQEVFSFKGREEGILI